jgi:hypothetical protein
MPRTVVVVGVVHARWGVTRRQIKGVPVEMEKKFSVQSMPVVVVVDLTMGHSHPVGLGVVDRVETELMQV